MAVILALLFRGFVAEAFVIPTGSMAPTLQGRHKDIECPKCGAWYQISGSRGAGRTTCSTGQHVDQRTCPICRYTQRLDPFKQAQRRLVQRRPDHRRQVLLRPGRAQALGRDRLQVSRQRRRRTTSSG